MAEKTGKGGARGIRYGEEFPEERPPAFPEEITPILQQILEELRAIRNKLRVAPEAVTEYYNTVQTIIEATTPTQPTGPDDITSLPTMATWKASTAYSVGTKVKPTTATGYAYECTTAGTSGTTEPTWPNSGTVADGTLVWTCISAAGYQKEEIYNKLKRIAPKVTIINDTKSTDGNGTLYVIVTQDGSSWSNETPILFGEARTFYNVWELRLRSPAAGNLTTLIGGVYRVTEYDFWLAYSNVISSTANRSDFAARSLQGIGLAGTGTQLPDITVPDGFALVVRATPGNAGNVYLARTQADTNDATKRNTLAAGDSAKLWITNANLAWVAGSMAGQNVDILVEQ